MVSRTSRARAAEHRFQRPGWRHLVRVHRDGVDRVMPGKCTTICSSSPFLVQAFLSWMVLRWIVGNLSSNGQPLPIAFQRQRADLCRLAAADGALAVFTIIGWAWVITAWVRWICRNISGTRREIIFNASGLEMLWRTIVFAIGCVLPHSDSVGAALVHAWYASQFALVERAATLRYRANAITAARAPSLPAPPTPPACRRA